MGAGRQEPEEERSGTVGGRFGAKWLLLALTVVAAAGLLALQVRRVEATLARSANHALARSFGPSVTVSGTPDIHLLPRPHVVLSGIRFDGTGDAQVDIPTLEATQSFASLLSGRLTFAALRLVGPHISVDADRLTDNTSHAALGMLGRAFPGRITIESGTLVLRSRHAALQGAVTELDAVLDGIDRNGAATLKGRATWRGERLDLSARIAPFFDFALGREASGVLKLQSRLLTAAIEGQLHAGIRGGFEGDVSASSPHLADLLRTTGLPGTLGHVAERVSFSGSGIANADTITFSDAHVGVDDTAFEGSLAWQPNGGHWAWTGTFATDTLDLRPGFAALPALRDRSGRWSDAPWSIDPALLGDVDLRISAAHALLGPITIEDAAFSALCRGGRIEAGFSEARSLDGLIRGRVVAAVTGRAIDLRVDLSMSQMDLDPLAQALGTKGMSGSASGRLVAEARGATPRALVESLGGRGQISVRDGSLPALPGIADLSALRLDAPAWLRSRATLPFDLATADLDLAGNRLKIVDGRVIESGSQTAFSAEASLLDRSFSVRAGPVSSGGEEPGTDVTGVLGSPPRILRASSDGGLAPATTRDGLQP